MCGRYYIEIDEKELQEVCSEVQKNTPASEQMTFKTSGEIFPTNVVPVQTSAGDFQAMKWGFSGWNKKLIINAKSETAFEKPMFQRAMIERRCIIPASGYYEWQSIGEQKRKYQFYLPDQAIHLAGCYRQEKDSPICSFVILTKPAANGLDLIHNRMPVIIPQRYIMDWLTCGEKILNTAVDGLEYKVV